MTYRRIALSAAACLIASALFGEEPECATNYRSDANASETFVMTGLSPKAAIERLPRLLAAAGASMQWTEPEKGVLKAKDLDVKAEVSGNATRVTFRSSTGADKTALCRYAALVGNPPPPPMPAQDPALIAQLEDDLIAKHQIDMRKVHGGRNSAILASRTDFLELTIKSVKQLAADKRQYEISMLLPRAACVVAAEDTADAAAGFGGISGPQHAKQVRVEATLDYTNAGGTWHLTDATISHIEGMK
jgi:hypothetical protein